MTTSLNELKYKTESEWRQWADSYKPGDEIPREFLEFVNRTLIPGANQRRQDLRDNFEKTA